ncbi:MAG: SAM-dependent methyltransferase [Trebonia sp.]
MVTQQPGHAAALSDAPGLFAGWRDAGADPSKASIARVYDYWVGGTHNFVADRELAERMATLDPRIPAACKANRAFLGRAVRFLASQGIRQFLDIGSGIPTAGNVHEVAQQAAPGSRVVYVDRDPVAVAEGRKLLSGNDGATVIQADVREPGRILSHPETTRLIDFREPVALMMVAVLHFVTDADDPGRIADRFRAATAPGSYLVISHVTSEANPGLTAAAEEIYNNRGADGQARSREQIARLFGGWEMTGPGLVYAPAWRPDRPQDVPLNPERLWFLAGAAIKPARM